MAEPKSETIYDEMRGWLSIIIGTPIMFVETEEIVVLLLSACPATVAVMLDPWYKLDIRALLSSCIMIY